MPKICIFGAGAIGGIIGCNLCSSIENEVSVIARNKTLAAIRSDGWKLQTASGIRNFRVTASDNPEELGVQDFVVISVKAHTLNNVIDKIAPLVGPDTQIITAINGIPWWFNEGLEVMDGKRITVLDPVGSLRDAIPKEKVIGCVVTLSASTMDDKPGHIFHNVGDCLVLGTPTKANEHYLLQASSLFKNSELKVKVSSDIRREIWYKLWANMTLNPISAITGATLEGILGDEFLSTFCINVMNEAKLVGEKIGISVTLSPEERNYTMFKLGPIRTSMLEDRDKGRPLELDPILASVVELAGLMQVEVPNMAILFGMSRLYARTNGLYPQVPSHNSISEGIEPIEMASSSAVKKLPNKI